MLVLLRIALAAALTLGFGLQGVPQGVQATLLADANGDARVDVLDVQQVIAAALHGASAPATADINGDGVVDVLDIQSVLDQANGQTLGAPMPPQPRALALTAVHLAARMPLPVLPLVVCLPPVAAQALPMPEPGFGRVSGPPGGRYGANLLSHAPPAGGVFPAFI